MTWLLPLLRHRVLWAAAALLVVSAGVRLWGGVQYRTGYAVGFSARAADAQRDAAAASEAASSRLADALASVIHEQQKRQDAERAASRARAVSAKAEARLADALASVHTDTVPPSPACGELATACANAQAAWTAERDTLSALIAVQDTAIMTLRSTVADEHTRTRAAVQSALVQQRATFRAPSRSRWATVGAVAGAILTWGVLR